MEDIIACCTQGPGAYDVAVDEFGAVAAALSIAERLESRRGAGSSAPVSSGSCQTG
jgi:hypothetical protein